MSNILPVKPPSFLAALITSYDVYGLLHFMSSDIIAPIITPVHDIRISNANISNHIILFLVVISKTYYVTVVCVEIH